jgi:hypothetical protein
MKRSIPFVFLEKYLVNACEQAHTYGEQLARGRPSELQLEHNKRKIARTEKAIESLKELLTLHEYECDVVRAQLFRWVFPLEGFHLDERNEGKLKKQLAVFSNGFAPPGWCEIQRLDETEDGSPCLESDHEAGLVVSIDAGMPGTCMLYSPVTKCMYPEGVETEEATVVIVPVDAAFRLKLIDRKEAKKALTEWT